MLVFMLFAPYAAVFGAYLTHDAAVTRRLSRVNRFVR